MNRLISISMRICLFALVLASCQGGTKAIDRNDQLPTHTVTYSANGGSGSAPVDASSYSQGAAVTVLGNTGGLVRTGYSFSGWNTQADGNGTDRAPASTFIIGAANVTLYAKWITGPAYSVTYNANGGNGSVPVDPSSYSQGTAVTVLGNTGGLVRTGYSFSGWNTQANGNGTDRAPASTFIIGAANVTLYAKWITGPAYSVTYNANGANGSVPVDPSSYSQGTAVTVLGNTGGLVRTGYFFSGWNTQADGTGTDRAPASTFTIGAANVTLYAKWAAGSTYRITYNANEGTGSVPVDANAYSPGATVTVQVQGSLTRAGYTFTGWNTQPDRSGTSRAANSTFAMGSADVVLYAKWSNKKLIFIHHSCGANWLAAGNGNLGTTLNAGNFYVTESDYGWDAEPNDNLGDSTDTRDWPSWFNDQKMPYVYANNYHSAYTNSISNPGGENEIIMFKSCYPLSEVESSIDDEKAIYNSLLPYFAAHPNKLFILITPPGESVVSSYQLTKELCNWLVNTQTGWLSGYSGNNVRVFDFYGVLSEIDSHHRRSGGSTEYVYAADYDGGSPYHDGDDHPNAMGNQKATAEYITMLNYFYDTWK
jgi:uncharacterized repeat protein (TIGR02543 family)